jgi:F-type H+-transporting ATPase subunit b
MTIAGIFLLPNGTFFIELFVSIILIVLIYKYVLPPINKAMEERQEKIRTALESADQARADAEAADDERRNVLEQARQQAREIVATAEQVRTDNQARGQAEYERIVGNADVEIALARQRAVEEAASRMGEVVMEVVERIIGREVNLEMHRDLIDEAVIALRNEPDSAAAAGTGARP